MPPPLRLLHCLPHTSYLGFFAAFSSNTLPCFGEIILLFFSFNAKTYIDQQTTVPSFWFRWWRPGFLITSILFDVGMLAYCIYIEDIFVVLLAVRITVGLYQLSDQVWMIKNWVPFFVQKEKRRLLFLRVYLIDSIWYLVVGSTSWTSSWQDRNVIFANVYYIIIFLIIFFCGLWYLIKGGVDFFVTHRYHWTRNIMILFAINTFILGVVGLVIGDGGGNNLILTLNYHSAFAMIYFGVYCTVAVVVHYFILGFEELSWKYPNPSISSSTLSRNGSTTFEATNGILSGSNKIVCDVDMPSSSIEGVRTGSISDGNVVGAPPTNHNKVAISDTVERFVEEEDEEEEDGKVEGDLEAACGLVSQSAAVSVGDAPSAISPPVTASTRAGSILVPYQAKARRRLALAFDGITRRSSKLRGNILTHHVMTAKLKRHELVSIEMDKLYCVIYQMILWESVMWLAQTFLTLYLRSVNTPSLPGRDGYYCQTPLENTINSVQFANDFVFARR